MLNTTVFGSSATCEKELREALLFTLRDVRVVADGYLGAGDPDVQSSDPRLMSFFALPFRIKSETSMQW